MQSKSKGKEAAIILVSFLTLTVVCSIVPFLRTPFVILIVVSFFLAIFYGFWKFIKNILEGKDPFQ